MFCIGLYWEDGRSGEEPVLSSNTILLVWAIINSTQILVMRILGWYNNCIHLTNSKKASVKATEIDFFPCFRLENCKLIA